MTNYYITKENIQIALNKGIISTIGLAQYFKCGKTLFNKKVKALGMRDYIENARQVYRTNRDNYIKQHRKIKPVYQIDISTGNILNTFTSSYQAVKAIGAKGHSNHIYDCCCGKCQKAYGYYWKFKE